MSLYGIKTSAQALSAMNDAQHCLAEAALKQPHRLADKVNEVEEWHGVATVLAQWETALADIAEAASGVATGEDAWSAERVLLAKYRVLARMAVRGADDSWSGRGNDARRAFHDGQLKALSRIETMLAYDEEA